MTGSNNKSHLDYLNKLVDGQNDSYDLSFGKKLIHADYSA